MTLFAETGFSDRHFREQVDVRQASADIVVQIGGDAGTDFFDLQHPA